MGAGSSFWRAAWRACCWKSAPRRSSRHSFQLASNQYALMCSSFCVLVRTKHLHHDMKARTSASVPILTRIMAHSMASKASRSDRTPFGLQRVSSEMLAVPRPNVRSSVTLLSLVSLVCANGLGLPAASTKTLQCSCENVPAIFQFFVNGNRLSQEPACRFSNSFQTTVRFSQSD